MFEVEDGSAGDSESGNIVLKSAVDDTEEATNVVLLHWVRKSLRIVMQSLTQLDK